MFNVTFVLKEGYACTLKIPHVHESHLLGYQEHRWRETEAADLERLLIQAHQENHHSQLLLEHMDTERSE